MPKIRWCMSQKGTHLCYLSLKPHPLPLNPLNHFCQSPSLLPGFSLSAPMIAPFSRISEEELSLLHGANSHCMPIIPSSVLSSHRLMVLGFFNFFLASHHCPESCPLYTSHPSQPGIELPVPEKPSLISIPLSAMYLLLWSG